MSEEVQNAVIVVPQRRHKADCKLPSLDKRYNRSDVIDCIWRCCGIRTQICAMLDCTPRQLNAWLNRHPEARAEMSSAKEGLLNKAEEVILDALASPDERTRLEAAKTVFKQVGQPAVQVNIGLGSKQQQVQAIFGVGPATASGQEVDDEELLAD